MNPWGPYGISAWMAIWAELLSPKAYLPTYEDGAHFITPESFTDEHIEASVMELREDMEVLTPDDLTKGRGRSR